MAVVSQDYAEHTKFADDWLAAPPGADGALAMAMGHVILKEFYVERQVPYFEQYARRFTDPPLLVTLRDGGNGALLPDRLLRASDLVDSGGESEHAEWKPVVLDVRRGEPAVPNGSVGHRYGQPGRWNLRLEGIEPVLTLLGRRVASRWRSICPASTSARRSAVGCCAAACRRSGSAGGS